MHFNHSAVEAEPTSGDDFPLQVPAVQGSAFNMNSEA